MRKNIIFSSLLLLAFIFNYNSIGAAPVSMPVKPAETSTQTAVTSPVNSYISVSPIDVVNNPNQYLNKSIKFDAEFVAYSSLGLDYKPAFRDAAKYISILIKREDSKNHTIPLSEMKIFVTREIAEKNVDLEIGDKIYLEGKVFSTALGDPWMDVENFKVISSKKDIENKETK